VRPTCLPTSSAASSSPGRKSTAREVIIRGLSGRSSGETVYTPVGAFVWGYSGTSSVASGCTIGSGEALDNNRSDLPADAPRMGRAGGTDGAGAASRMERGRGGLRPWGE
jgi:hypothetical protein